MSYKVVKECKGNDGSCLVVILVVFVYFWVVVQLNNIATKVDEIHKEVVPAKVVPVETVPIYG